jgi:hypothetical protein
MKRRMLLAAAAAALTVPVLALASGTAMHPELSAKLVGKVEVPKGSPTGHGIVNLTLNAKTGKVCWKFQGIAGIDKPTAAHIHKAPAGKAGAVVVPFGTAYKAKGCTSAAKKLVAAIESNPNAYYVNVHTAKYPNGAIRGQLVAGMAHM